MKGVRGFVAAVLTLAAICAFGQSWQGPYEEGIKAARAGKWADARAAFLAATAQRPGDISAPTNLPGPPTERRQWRDGAAYSPNFLAAYAAYRQALETSDTEQKALLTSSAAEMQALVDKKQAGPEAYYYLNVIYGRLGDNAKQKSVESRFASSKNAAGWREDTEVVAPEDLALIRGANVTSSGAAQPLANTVTAESLTRTGVATPAPGAVATLNTKFALVVGNTAGEGLSFAITDAKRVRNALLTNAGYPEENVVLITDGTAQQIQDAATQLGERVPEEGTVMIFFAGRGAFTDGKDYLAGSDNAMVAKTDLFRPFVLKGARIFAFFQVNRPMTGDDFFGKEIPAIGAIAQMQATAAGGTVERTVRGGAETGVFADAFTRVLMDLRSNQVPVMEFGWQVFYKVRRGDTGTTGGGSQQTPTLPMLTNLAADARF